MQYRIDHLENAKADAFDLMIQPPLKIVGDVEEFAWGPSDEIYCGEGGDVVELGKNANPVVLADNLITDLENKMELYADVPREAMCHRTSGENTDFEVKYLKTDDGTSLQKEQTKFDLKFINQTIQ